LTGGYAHGAAVLALGLTLLTMAYAISHISGCHLNPAVSAGLVVGKRFSALKLGPSAPIVGAAIAGVVYPAIAEERQIGLEKHAAAAD
jgi:aquaporin Z